MSVDNVITIGEECYILDPSGRGEYAFPASLEEHLVAQQPRKDEALPGYIPEYSATWREQQKAREDSEYCLKPGCPKARRPHGKYCSYKHERSYQARRYRMRQKGITRWIEAINGVPFRFERPFPGNSQQARRVFAEHIALGVCQYANEDGYCPSSSNPYADPSNPRCLIYATMADDLLVWTARHRGMVVERRYTTTDGAWKDQPWKSPISPLARTQ